MWVINIRLRIWIYKSNHTPALITCLFITSVEQFIIMHKHNNCVFNTRLQEFRVWWIFLTKVVLFCTLGHQTCTHPFCQHMEKVLKICEKRNLLQTGQIIMRLHLWKTSARGYKHVMTLFWVVVSAVSSRQPPVGAHFLCCPAERDILDLVIRLRRTRDVIYVGFSVSGGGLHTGAAVIQAWLISLWQWTEATMLVSAGSQTLKNQSPPPTRRVAISILMASVSQYLSLAVWLIHLSH